jgi:hypothetical protein
LLGLLGLKSAEKISVEDWQIGRLVESRSWLCRCSRAMEAAQSLTQRTLSSLPEDTIHAREFRTGAPYEWSSGELGALDFVAVKR